MKERQTQHWDAAADGSAAWFDWTERNFQPLTAWLECIAGQPAAARILDVASGAGYPALALARAVRPEGRVVATDISQRMMAIASERARTERLENIEFAAMDAEALQFEDGSFDVVTNAYGLMFCPDPLRALSEAHRVLAPGGRVAIVTWDEPSRNPFFTVIRGAAAGFLGLSEQRAGDPGPFRLAPADPLESLLATAGFSSISVESVPMTFECESAQQYCRLFSDIAWSAKTAALSPREAERFNAAVAEAVRPYVEGGRVRLMATSLRASARK